MTEETIEIRVNGAERRVPRDFRVGDLVRELGLAPEVVAVEVNRELVPRRARAERLLANGDLVELVTLVGGG